MAHGDLGPALPIAATMDLQYRLPPFQQILYTPTIIISLVMLGIALAVVLYLARRAKIRARKENRREALKLVEKILLKRGGSGEDVDRMLFIFSENPKIDPAAIVMIRERFQRELVPLLAAAFGKEFAARMEKSYFPPPKDTRHTARGADKDLKTLLEEKKEAATGQTPATILDLMDATLRPGVIARLTFEGMEGGHECLVMGHDMQAINVTLPANNDRLVAFLRPGMRVDGTLESGPSLLAFTSTVVQAVAGSMPYCRISAWKSAWEIRKRDSVRLPISIEIDFQHISTSQTESIKMSNLDREIGSIRPGRLIDLSLGGCAVETPSATVIRIGDMIRFSKSLVEGTPPVTLLGAVVNIDDIDPETNDGAKRRLHIQFLIIDDVSQRILVRILRQLHDVAEKDEWMKAQLLLQQMRRNKIENIGSPTPARRESSRFGGGAAQKAGNKPGTSSHRAKGTGPHGAAPRTGANRPPTTRSIPKIPGHPPPQKPPKRHTDTR